MGNYINKGQDGVKDYQIQAQSTETVGTIVEAVADTAVVVTDIDATAGIVIVKDETTTDSATFGIKDIDGTVTLEQILVNANFDLAKDNGGTINVYVESGVINIQNLSGGAVDIRVKAFV